MSLKSYTPLHTNEANDILNLSMKIDPPINKADIQEEPDTKA